MGSELIINISLLSKKAMFGKFASHEWAVELKYNDKSEKFIYHTSSALKPTEDCVIEALAVDCAAAKMGFIEYTKEFGEDEAKVIYTQCQNNYNKMYRLFGDELDSVIEIKQSA